MLQANPSVLTVSPPESGFAPRREFVRENHVSSTFALLAIAGAGLVRLSSFSPQLVASLRHNFETHQTLSDIREEKNLDLVEFNLDGKPWTQAKSARSEKLFVEILAEIFQNGYRFVSTIDYGREHDDRVSIAFSKSVSLPSFEIARVPFALSFPSSTVLRVINPPLNSSPAILQAARSAWPRGVISERKVSDKCFEFRLKGYKWFQEDTFSSDSLQLILSLLNAMDRHAFSLLTSISLSGNHSRAKDLWIFSGLPQESSSDTGSNGELSRSLSPTGSKNALFSVPTSSSLGANNPADTLHARSGSLQGPSPVSSSLATHARSATYPNASPLARSNSAVLRKKGTPGPVGALPSAQYTYSRTSEEEFPMWRNNLSAIDSVDMTGVGSPNQRNFITARINNGVRSPSPRSLPLTSTEKTSFVHNEPNADNHLPYETGGRIKSGDLFYETGHYLEQSAARTSSPEEGIVYERRPPIYSADTPSGDHNSDSHDSSRQLTSRDTAEPPDDVPRSVYDRVQSQAQSDSLTPILGPNAFRDSAFSSATNRSYEIPIAWTGASDSEKGRHPGRPMEHDASPETDEEYAREWENGSEKAPRSNQRLSASNKFPGAWQPTPIAETPEEHGELSPTSTIARERTPERKEVDAERVASPELSNTPGATRKSEVALYGMVSGQTANGNASSEQEKRSSDRAPFPPSNSGGWVLVNVADNVSEQGTSSKDETTKSDSSRKASSDRRGKSSSPSKASMSPITKAIAAEDAAALASNQSQSTSALKRFFSGSKRFRKTSSDTGVRRPSFREKWRKKGSMDT
ncbi:hypothetical protein DFH11DRAFT_1755648 [Phellopilus nigrolimitatus]|nr:hypothetical protein DFH11DRAFT_1755648 [Phellopilus nigrolimitatus]